MVWGFERDFEINLDSGDYYVTPPGNVAVEDRVIPEGLLDTNTRSKSVMDKLKKLENVGNVDK